MPPVLRAQVWLSRHSVASLCVCSVQWAELSGREEEPSVKEYKTAFPSTCHLQFGVINMSIAHLRILCPFSFFVLFFFVTQTQKVLCQNHRIAALYCNVRCRGATDWRWSVIRTDQSPRFCTHVIRRLTDNFNHHRVKVYNLHALCLAKVELGLPHHFLRSSAAAHTEACTRREIGQQRICSHFCGGFISRGTDGLQSLPHVSRVIELKMWLNYLPVSEFSSFYCTSESIARCFVLAHVTR